MSGLTSIKIAWHSDDSGDYFKKVDFEKKSADGKNTYNITQ